METTQKQPVTATTTRRDIHQQVTDTIIQQLEAGTVPWHKPWKGDDNRLFSIPKNMTTGNNYRGINILLLWSSTIAHDFPTQDWGSFKQWQQKNEAVRKGEKGSMVVYYDTLEKEVDGEIKKIPFLKTSVVFNRSQLASYQPLEETNIEPLEPLVQRLEKVDQFITNTGAIVKNIGNSACYLPSKDEIWMPPTNAFIDTVSSTATEGYYGSLTHELMHWSGSANRLNRKLSEKFGNKDYAVEELVAELGAAFLCSELEITATTKPDHASYIASWLKALKDNKQFIFTAASEASKAVDYLQALQPNV